MNLNAMTLADLGDLASQIDTLSKAAWEIEQNLLNRDRVLIRMTPGQVATIVTGLRMPDLNGPIIDFVIDEDDDFSELPGGSPAPEHWAGSGACSGVENAESPADEAPRSGASAGEGPVAAETAGAATGEGQAEPPVAADTPEHDPPAPATTSAAGEKLGMDWARTEEVQLVEGVARRVRAGMTKTVAIREAAAEIGRTEAASTFRLNKKLSADYLAAMTPLDPPAAPAEVPPAPAVVVEPSPPAQPEVPPAPPVAVDPAPPAQPRADRPRINLPDAPPSLVDAMIASPPARQREIAEAIARVPSRRGFDPELDLEIVEGFSLGTTPDVLAADLGLDSKGVRDRFKELSACIRDAKGNMDFADQSRLLAVLRQIVRDARGTRAA